MKTRLIAILLCMAMVVGLLPALTMTSFADEKIYISYQNFPDVVIRNYIIETMRPVLKEDNYGIYAMASDVRAVEEFDVSGKLVRDMTGIELFTGLKVLHCENNMLTKLDVSKNLALEKLYCSNNRLTALDLSKNVNLWALDCSGQVTSAKCQLKAGQYWLYMHKLVGNEYVSRVKFTPVVNYNETNGITIFTKLPKAVTYYFYTTSIYEEWTRMDVTVNIVQQKDRMLSAPTEMYSDATDYYDAAGITIADLTDDDGLAEGQTFTVSSEKACVVAFSPDGGETYTELAATKAEGENAYSFTIPELTDDFLIGVVLKGDTNGDGKVDATDALRIQRYVTNDPDEPYERNFELLGMALLAADTTAEGLISSGGALRILRFLTNDPDAPYTEGTYELPW